MFWKLMKPLFHGNVFNREGRRMRAVFVKSVSDGTSEYRLWCAAGSPDRDYASAEDDKYYLYAEINGFLAPTGMTKAFLADRCGIEAVNERHGGRSFPDFFGALVMDDLAGCAELSSAYKAVRQEERQARAAHAAEEDKVFCEEQNKLAEQAVADAVRTIREGGELKNDTVTFYRSKYNASACSVVLCLMRRYGIDVPLRTQGWINNKLIDVSVRGGYCGSIHFWRSKRGRGSTAFYAYMNQLIRAVAEQLPNAGKP